MTVTTDALIPALEDVRNAHTAIVDRFRADMAVTPAGPHRQTLERHAAETQGHVTRINDHIRGIRPSRLLRDAGDMVQSASTDVVRAAMLHVSIGARVVRGILPGQPQVSEHQLLKNTAEEYTAAARALALCRAGESVASLAQDDRATAMLSVLRRQDEQLLHALESCVEEQALAFAAGAAADEESLAYGGLTHAARAMRSVVDRVRHAASAGGRHTAHSAADTARGVPPVTRMTEKV
ncbi:hypothetical protein [Streptomyces sp. NPDC001070]